MLFHNYLPLEKGVPLHLNTWIPFTQGCFVPSMVEIGPLVLKRRFLKFVNVFSLYCNYLPLEEGKVLQLKNLESHSPKDTLCQVLLKLVKWFWRRRRRKCEKFTTTTTKTDNKQIVMKKAHLSLWLRWANKTY